MCVNWASSGPWAKKKLRQIVGRGRGDDRLVVGRRVLLAGPVLGGPAKLDLRNQASYKKSKASPKFVRKSSLKRVPSWPIPPLS